jgi:restriction endonuclease S subunit
MDFSVLNNKMGVPCINREDVYKLTIPLPPLDIQQKIITECQAVDSQEASLNAKISSCRERIEALFRELEALPAALNFTLEDKRAFTLAIGKRVLNSEVIPDGKIPVFSANVFEPFGYVNEFLRGFEDFSQDSILWGIDGDFMVNFMQKDTPFYPTDHCGVISVLTDKVHPRYLARILEREGRRLGFSRSYRASLDRIGGITIAVPDIDAQAGAMNEVLSLEEQIMQTKSDLKGLSGIKAAILKNYVN